MVYGSLVLLELWVPIVDELFCLLPSSVQALAWVRLIAELCISICLLSFCQAQLSAGMEDGRVILMSFN